MQILIVDDDPIALEILVNAVLRNGHEVLTATNGEEALRMLSQSECRLVISDWEMPRMDGLELCRAVRLTGAAGYTYFILLTGHDSAEERIAGLSAGADDFISKPFNPAELAVRIRSAERILALETRDVTIFAMAKLAESRDPETGAHLERVQSYARELAQYLAGLERFRDQIDDEFIRLIYQTSPLHDIGKVGIPDAVLLKPGRLSDREFAIMKTHATLGAQTLEAALGKYPGAKFLQMARDIAAAHHERFDGSGYPAGLRGEQIPLSARIVALADVYDALTTKRVYKEAFAHEIARSILVSEKGTHFDPAVVEAFEQREDVFRSIRERFSEAQRAAA
jgi:putative two-component system response regulator